MNKEAENKIVEGLHKLWETSLLQNVKKNPEWATNEIQNQYATRMKYEIEIGELKEKNKKLKIKNKNLKSKIDKVNRILNANTHVENIYHALCNLFDEEYQYEIDNEELNKILKEDK